jgi:hypothetical protein
MTSGFSEGSAAMGFDTSTKIDAGARLPAENE